ncbi:MAG TPA: hypothetical protein VKK79_09890, partial [Candidatus Lokiarchaeia archaeon]|nr:hypothetical protein [Candidatus Lokiarchaeia archaeon]
ILLIEVVFPLRDRPVCNVTTLLTFILIYQIPIEQVRQMAGVDLANMYQRFENEPYLIDIDALHQQCPEVGWHNFREWAETIEWAALLS